MKKLNAVKSTPRQQQKNVDLTNIVALTPPKTQSQKLERLNQAIRKGETKEILEILAQSQIEGDLARFVIATLQYLGGVE